MIVARASWRVIHGRDARATFSDFGDYQRAVLRSETNAVAERDPHVALARGVGDIVEITIRIGFVEVDCGRNDARFHRAQGRAQTGGAAGPLRMADLRFGSGHGDLV